MEQLNLPQICRKIAASTIPAGIRVGVWVILLPILAINVLSKQPGPRVYRDRWFQKLIGTGRVNAFSLTSSSPSFNVLGATASEPQQNLNQERALLKAQYAYWQTVVTNKPDYRDAYVILAALSYQLAQPQQALAYLKKVQTLDPNLAIVQKFLPLVTVKE